MTLKADLDRAGFSVVLDLRHPFAGLALRPTLELARSMSLEVDWLPLAVPTLNPPSQPGPDDDRGILHRRARAEAIAREVETYAAAQGLVMRDWYRSGAADAAHLGWLYMRDRHPEQLSDWIVELFRSYWAARLDPSRVEQVGGLIAAVAGAEAAASFHAWARSAGPEALQALEAELRRFGLHQVPAYVVQGEVFYGRQHLPMIRWILEGRAGRPPI